MKIKAIIAILPGFVLLVSCASHSVDQVPLNKVIAFGGDYRVAVQKTYGHLTIARQAVACALGHHIEAGTFDYRRAEEIAGLWFYENPKRIYGL